jgi:hypothetical protein
MDGCCRLCVKEIGPPGDVPASRHELDAPVPAVAQRCYRPPVASMDDGSCTRKVAALRPRAAVGSLTYGSDLLRGCWVAGLPLRASARSARCRASASVATRLLGGRRPDPANRRPPLAVPHESSLRPRQPSRNAPTGLRFRQRATAHALVRSLRYGCERVFGCWPTAETFCAVGALRNVCDCGDPAARRRRPDPANRRRPSDPANRRPPRAVRHESSLRPRQRRATLLPASDCVEGRRLMHL